MFASFLVVLNLKRSIFYSLRQGFIEFAVSVLTPNDFRFKFQLPEILKYILFS